MTLTIHQRFVSRLPSLQQEMGEELFVSGLVGPYRIFQRKKGHRHGIDEVKRHITEDGLFVFCFPFQQKSRCIKLVSNVGFRLMTIRDIVPMKSKPALFSLYCASLSFPGAVTEEEPLIVAFEDGRYTPEMRALQATRGFGPEGTNVIA